MIRKYPLALAALLLTCTAHAQNLLTVNPSFENGGGTFGNGSVSFNGWIGANWAYNYNGVATGNATDGTHDYSVTFGGYLQTAPSARPPVSPGSVYELNFDAQTYFCGNPGLQLGTVPHILFFDSAGNQLKDAAGLTDRYQAQSAGVYPYQTFRSRAVAPPNAATAAVETAADRGSYPNQDLRSVYWDNYKFTKIAETQDQIGVRSFRHLIQAGQSSALVLKVAATGPRDVLVRLVEGTSNYAITRTSVLTGRGLINVSYPVPSSAPTATDYSWQMQVVSTGGAWGSGPGSATATLTGVFLDGDLKTNSGPVTADNTNLLFMGRIGANGTTRSLYWYGSEMRARFSGTSFTVNVTSSGNGYGGYQTANFAAIIDGNVSGLANFSATGVNQSVKVASGLASGIHTLTIFKTDESASDSFTVNSVTLDSGCGLLRPEPLPTRKIEIYGDSVTSGGSASPNYVAYAPLLARELNADVHIISKGGTGVAASFSGMVTLPQYWNLLNFPNAFSVSGSPVWNFSQWQPDVVVIAIGHNDQFNGGTPKFPAAYASFVHNVRAVYPNADIFCCNTVISAPLSLFDPVVPPLIDSDSKIHYLFQPNSWTDPNTGHPPTAAHAAMVYGDASHASMADWIEDNMNWGVNGVLFPHNTWTSNTIVNQAENLAVAASSGKTNRVIDWPGFTNGTGSIYDATAVNDYVTYLVPNVSVGVYEVLVGVKETNTRDIWQLSIGKAGSFSTTATAVGSPQDEYAPSETFAEYDLGTWSPGSTSDKWFQFMVTGKNASSSNYSTAFDYIKLIHR